MITPILFLVFNRPETTIQAFEKIRQAKPTRLYIAGDGPREDNLVDKEKVKEVREILTKVDWNCNIKTLFRDKNLGCKKAVSSAITWFFQHEKQGIIIEDDCVAHLDFFTFCENLLFRYANDERISVITGNNFQNNKWRGNASYYFSKYNHCWGWASWRRAWNYYEGDLAFWPKWSKTNLWFNKTPDKVERNYWENVFNATYNNKINSWAYPWTASVWYKGGLTITPNVNLVSNIGFGEKATHTYSKNSNYSEMIVEKLNKIKHPKIIERNSEADMWVFNYHYQGKYLRFPHNLLILRLLRFLSLRLKIFFRTKF